MAEATQAAPRKRTAATTTKTAPAKRAAKPAAVAAAPESGEVITLALEQMPDTKTYAVFSAPEGSGCVGKLYVPKGTKVVKVRVER